MANTVRNNGINLVDYRNEGVVGKVRLVGKSLLGIFDTAGEVILAGSEALQGVANYPLNKIVDRTEGNIQQFTQDKIDSGTQWVLDQFKPETTEPVKEETKESSSSSKEDKIKELLNKLDEDKLDTLLKALES